MATVNVRIDEKLKKDAEKVLNDLGLSLSGAISVYFAQIVKQQQIPFRLQSKKLIDPDNYYSEAWYQSEEANELRRRINEEEVEKHALIDV